MRTITVYGSGSAFAAPDTIEILLESEIIKPDYAETTALSAKNEAELLSALENIGIKAENIKTTRYGVSAQYETNYEDDKPKRVFVGYRLEHCRHFKFPLSQELLGKVLCALGNLECAPYFEVRYILSDETALRDQSISRAVEDASRKALLLAKSAEVVLGKVISIEYPDIAATEYREMSMDRAAVKLTAMSAPELSFDDISAEARVTMIWEII